MFIEKNYNVEYAHRLKDHCGKCKNIHGHSGRVKIVFSGQLEKETGMIVDFGNFGWLKELVEQFDHSLVLDVDDPLVTTIKSWTERMMLLEGPPTAENMSKYLFISIKTFLETNEIPLVVESVMFEETEGNSTTFSVLDV